MAEEPSPIWKRTLVWLNYQAKASKGKTRVVDETSHLKQLTLKHVCKIRLKDGDLS